MFNENFSFLSSTSTSLDLINDFTTTTDISPFTSRSSSPRPRYGSTSHPQSSYQRDPRYDTPRAPRHPSITALTAQLESHALSSQQDHTMTMTFSPSTTRRNSLSSDTYTSPDEGFFESEDLSSPSTPNSSISSFDFDYGDFHGLSASSSPRPSLSLEAQALSSFTQRRRQRQALVRLQCLAKRAPDLAMLLEECHPSGADPVWGGQRSGSLSATSGGASSRVEKGQSGQTRVKGGVRMRKRATR